MGDPSTRAKAIFLEALEEHAPERWPAFLEQACAGDDQLRAEVERLLRARSEMGSFHEATRPAALAAADELVSERPGAVVGAYKLLEQIGEGGFGVVWHVYGFDLTTNAANLSVSGAGTEILDTNGNNALAGFTTNTATGHFTVGAGYNFTVQGTFLNAGVLEIGGTVSIQGNYTQTAGAALDIDIGGPSTYGTLTVSGTATLAGILNVALVNGFMPAPGESFTILTFGARSGDFSAKNGLIFSPTEHFVADYLGNTLTLVVGP
jgi:hypothetical protein